jgi:GT2 family glycosyltransferase
LDEGAGEKPDRSGPAMTVTTVLYNSEASLSRYAAALAPSVERGSARVIVVDNASPDGSAALMRELLPGAELIANQENLGFAAGCNRAWPQVRSRYWLLLNPDVEAGAEQIERLVEWMDRHPRVGLASPRLLGPDGREEPVARPHDSFWRPLVEALRLHNLVPRRLREKWLLSGRRATPETIDGWVPGAALIARSEAVAEVGPLDESLFIYGEDREWCWRMARAGWQIGVCGEAEFVHGHGGSARATWGERERTRREVVGHLRATRLMRGALWTRAFALLASLVLLTESLDPRPGMPRAARRARGRLYLRGALDPDPDAR